jgi:predicted GNAT family N-acyltransferase
LRMRNVELLWCNARVKARKFYDRMGFSTTGAVFDVAGIGPHFLMHRTM